MLDTFKLALIYCIVESREYLYYFIECIEFDRRFKSFLEKIPEYSVTTTTDGYIVERVRRVPQPLND